MSESEDDQQPCPRCPPSPDLDADCYESWLQCDICDTWVHSNCVGLGEDEAGKIDVFHCPDCHSEHGPSTFKKSKVRRSSRPHTQLDYSQLDEGEPAIFNQYTLRLEAREFEEADFPHVKNGYELTQSWLLEQEELVPIVIDEPDGLGMKMPPQGITVSEIATRVGKDTPVSVMDVLTQNELKGWKMKDWADYYSNPKDRSKILNVISLEISDTEFAKDIKRPNIVDKLDVVTNYWPEDLKKEETYPKIQLYCLMGVSECFTDFHVDFSGTWVYYHVLSGEKIFYFIAPTPTNLKKYEKWSKSPDQQSTFFGDEVKHCYKVTIKAGNTMIIPAGWIHAVYTPKDTVVIGGNYLVLGTFDKHLQIFNLETRTNVPMRYRLPHFLDLCKYLCVKSEKEFEEKGKLLTDSELFGLYSLSEFIENNVDMYTKRATDSGVIDSSIGKADMTALAQRLGALATLELNRRQKLPDEEKKPNFEGKMPKMPTRRNSVKLAKKKKSEKPKKSIKMRLKALVKARENRNNGNGDGGESPVKKEMGNENENVEEYLGTIEKAPFGDGKESESEEDYTTSDSSEADPTSSEDYSDAENYLSDEYDDLNKDKRKRGGSSGLAGRIKKNKPDVRAFMNINKKGPASSSGASPKSEKSRSVQQRIMQRLKMKIR